MQDQVWLSVKECAALMGVSPSTIQRNIHKYTHKTVQARGGLGFMIELSSLPVDAQRRYIKQVAAAITPVAAATPIVSEGEYITPTGEVLTALSAADRDMKIYNAATRAQRAFADKWLLILQATEGMTRKSIDAYCALNSAQGNKISASRIYAMRERHKAAGLAGLLPDWGKSKGTTTAPDDAYAVFKAAYMKEGAPSVHSCWVQAWGAYKMAHPEAEYKDFPSDKTFERRLKNEYNKETVFLARYGESAHKRYYQMFVDRDYSNINAGEIWVSDHAQIDVAVRLANGSVCFPWVTAWRDFKTGHWLGWMLEAGAANSDRIFQTFYYAANAYGLPKAVIIDNGKDYRSKDFAGGRKDRIKIAVDQGKTNAMLGKLGIYAHFANPYGSQTKPIERDFRTMKEYLSKNMIGYRGGNVVERPEVLEQEIKQGKIIDFTEFKPLFELFIERVLSVMLCGGKLKGQSRLGAFNAGFHEQRTISQDALALFCMRVSKPVSIGRDGVKDSKLDQWYWGEWMASCKGQKVYMRRDPKAYADAFVFDAATDSFLGKARLGALSAPAFAQTNVEREQLAAVLNQKARAQKLVNTWAREARAGAATPEQVIERLAVGMEHMAAAPVEARPIMVLSQTEMDSVIYEANTSLHDTDYGQLIPHERPTKSKIKLFQVED